MHSPFSQARSISPSHLQDIAPPSPTSIDESLPNVSQSSIHKSDSKSKRLIHHIYTSIHPALVLQNTGSVARDHLASERTFLAYIRTSLALASGGVALVQLFTISDLASKSTGIPLPAVNQRVQKFATPLGLSALGLAIIVLFVGELFFWICLLSGNLIRFVFKGVFRYFLVQHALTENRFPATRIPIAFISFFLGAITVVAFGALLSGKVQHH